MDTHSAVHSASSMHGRAAVLTFAMPMSPASMAYRKGAHCCGSWNHRRPSLERSSSISSLTWSLFFWNLRMYWHQKRCRLDLQLALAASNKLPVSSLFFRKLWLPVSLAQSRTCRAGDACMCQ